MDLYIAGLPLIGIVMAIVEWFKKFGVTGNWSILVSMLAGIGMGVGYQFATTPPVVFADWFTMFIYGLVLGLTASGVYDVGKTLVTKITDRQ
jgi:hypothetical protein